jgi:peptidoglycan hydrolase CwlO-like protein
MNAKKISLLIALPLFVFVLSGCGQKPVPQQTIPTAQTVEPEIQPDQKQQSQLPSDPVQAIDSETKSIDQEIDSTTEEIDSAELSDAQFGL